MRLPNPVYVTKTYLPNKEKYMQYIDKIYESNRITNYGILVKTLEQRLCEFLGVKNVVLTSSGTAALEIAYRTLGIKGFAITTPFSFVATTSSLVTNGILPIFADINPKDFNIDPQNIKKYITKNATAIVPVHVFGNPCKVEEIESISREYNLKVIYDAAHIFGVKYNGKTILEFGDISVLSFHATKIFHTIEGGALVINDEELVQKARYLINFGIQDEEHIPELGINAKMNEFEAAMGLCMLDDIDVIIKNTKNIWELYKKELKGYVEFQKLTPNTAYNYAYFPVLFKDETQLLKVKKALNEQNIFPRRYFYPSLDTLSYIEPKQECQISRDISKRILCLPIFSELSECVQYQIIELLRNNL